MRFHNMARNSTILEEQGSMGWELGCGVDLLSLAHLKRLLLPPPRCSTFLPKLVRLGIMTFLRDHVRIAFQKCRYRWTQQMLEVLQVVKVTVIRVEYMWVWLWIRYVLFKRIEKTTLFSIFLDARLVDSIPRLDEGVSWNKVLWKVMLLEVQQLLTGLSASLWKQVDLWFVWTMVRRSLRDEPRCLGVQIQNCSWT